MEESIGRPEHNLQEIIDELVQKAATLGQPEPELELDPEFTARLEDIYRALFTTSKMSATFSSELKFGLGHALGCKLTEWLWEHLKPSLKARTDAGLPAELRLKLPVDKRETLSKILRGLSSDFYRKTGVVLPSVSFEDADDESIVIHWRNLQLGAMPLTVSNDSMSNRLQRLFLRNAWRFLSTRQVETCLQNTWTQRPELHRAAVFENVGLLTYTNVLREMLKAGHSVLEFDLIVESILINRWDYGLKSDLAAKVVQELAGSLGSFPVKNEERTTEKEVFGSLPRLEQRARKKAEPQQIPLTELGLTDEVEIKLGKNLLGLVGNEGLLLERISAVRRKLVSSLGWNPPRIRIRDDITLEPSEFQVSIRGVEKVRAEIFAEGSLAIGPDRVLKDLPGVRGQEPASGLPGVWIEAKGVARAQSLGCMILSAVDVIACCLSHLLRGQAHKLFTHQSLRSMLDHLKLSNRALVDMVDEVPGLFAKAKTVFSSLLREETPIKDHITIFETLLESEGCGLQADALTERVREALGPLICRDHLSPAKELKAITLSKEVEMACLSTLRVEPTGPSFEPTPELELKLREAFRSSFRELAKTTLVTKPALRRPLRDFLATEHPSLFVFSEREIPTYAVLVSLGEVSLPKTWIGELGK